MTPRRTALSMIAHELGDDHAAALDVLVDYAEHGGDLPDLIVALLGWTKVMIPDQANAQTLARINLATLYGREEGT